MSKKRYAIPYDHDTKSWEEAVITARVINGGNRKVQKLKPDVRVEDNTSGGSYPAISNNVLLVERTSIESRIEAGDHAKIHLQLNDQDPKIHQVLKSHSCFDLRVKLYPAIDGADGKTDEPGLEVEGFTQVYVELPQTWKLTFSKTLWQESNPIDLRKVEGVPQEQLQALGDWGGKLVLKPLGLFQPDGQGSGERILSTRTIGFAGQCTLDRGNGQVLAGVWDKEQQAYIFEIEASQTGDQAQGPVPDLSINCYIEMQEGWEKRFQDLFKAARTLANQLDPAIQQKVREFVQGYLDFLAETTQDDLVARKEHIRTWVLNISQFVSYLEGAVELHGKSLRLFDSAMDRFVDNMINFTIELCFAMIDVLSYVYKWAKGSVKQAIKGSTKELVEELAEQTTKNLTAQKEAIESGIRTAREGIDSLDNQLASLRNQWPTDLSDPSPELLRKMDDLLTRLDKAMADRDELLKKVAKGSEDLVDLEANVAIAQYVKAHSGEVTEKEFMEHLKSFASELPENDAIRQIVANVEAIQKKDLGRIMDWGDSLNEAIKNLPADAPDSTRRELNRLLSYWAEFKHDVRVDVLWDFNKGRYTDMLVKEPLGQRLKKISEEAKKAKAAAEKIRYENVAWEHYKGFFSPLWWFMDASIWAIAWVYDWAKETFPWLADAETWLAMAVDTFLQFFMEQMNGVVSYMNSHLFIRSIISSDHRGRGKYLADIYGLGEHYFQFPKALKDYAKRSDDPKKIIQLGNSRSDKEAVKRNVEARVRGDYSQEKSRQTQQAKQLFATLCQMSLDAKFFSQDAPDRIGPSSMRRVLGRIGGPMVEYEKGFAASKAQATDYLTSISRFAESSTFQDMDGAIEWLAWAVAWTLRLGSLLAIGTGVGAAAVPTAFAAAQGVEWAAALLRPAVVILGTMPDIVGCQFDVVIASPLVFTAAVRGGVDPDSLIVEGYYAE
jgi:hypothetical protein